MKEADTAQTWVNDEISFSGREHVTIVGASLSGVCSGHAYKYNWEFL